MEPHGLDEELSAGEPDPVLDREVVQVALAELREEGVDLPHEPRDPVGDEPDFVRLNRNLNELLQELRISEVGVQILFAFLIALPFTSRFGSVTQAVKDVYVVTLLLAVMSSALMISPAAYHRIVFRHHRRAVLIRYASRVLIVGLAMLSLAMAGAIVVVTSFLFGSLFAALAGGGVALWIALFWYVIPVRTRLQCEREEARHRAALLERALVTVATHHHTAHPPDTAEGAMPNA
jgi:hypothetical protein